MADFYRVLFKENETLGVARITQDMEFALPYAGYVENWEPPLLQLCEGDFPDYLASDMGWRLCSERLKDILAKGASHTDVLQWLEVRVRSDGEQRIYFLLHFPDPPDVLDKQKTMVAGGSFVVKPVFSRASILDHRVFTFPKGGSLRLFVTNDVKLAIKAAACTGLQFSRVQVT